MSGQEFTGTGYPLAWAGGFGGYSHPWTAGAHSVIYELDLFSGQYLDSVVIWYYIPSNGDNKYRAGDYYNYVSYGGSGGTLHQVRCAAGKGVTGFNGRAGSYIDRIDSVWCADATIPDPFNTDQFNPYAGGSGGGVFGMTCRTAAPNHELLTGINLYSGNYIDGLGGWCTNALTQ